MRSRAILVVAAAIAVSIPVLGQSGRHLNPMVDLLVEGKPVFGLATPSARSPGGAGVPFAAVKTPLDLAKETLAHPEADYFFNGGMEGSVDRGIEAFTLFADALVEAGAIVKSPSPRLRAAINVKTPKISTDPAKAIENISRQLNAGVSSISFVVDGGWAVGGIQQLLVDDTTVNGRVLQ